MPSKWLLDKAIRVESPDNLAQSLLEARGYSTQQLEEFVRPNYAAVYDLALSLPDIDQAMARIKQALTNSEKIVIYGDYDIDGITASALLFDVLSGQGADVSVYIPDRFEEGYGINSTALEYLHEHGAQLVISVDCGITSVREVATASKFGLDVIVTDHHGLPEKLPDKAVALVNPKRSTDSALYELAGVGVAFMLVVALQKNGIIQLGQGQEKWLLDLVALGTICDVVPLVGINRMLAHYGLGVMRRSRRVGFKALCDVSSVEMSEITSEHVGFRFGPRLNAAGRLEHAQLALELLTTTDRDRARELADKVNQLNVERQSLTESTFVEALAQAEERKDDSILVLASPNWSHGIIGIVASRLVEKMHRPTILLQIQGKLAKGSARSLAGFNIIDAITQQSDKLEKFGGHAYAAGMTLKSDQIDGFRQSLNDAVAAGSLEVQASPVSIAAILAGRAIVPESVYQIQTLGPFGQGNSEPILMSSLEVLTFRPVGSDLSHLQIKLKSDQGMISAIAFRKADKWPWLKDGTAVDVAYTIGINEWQGNSTAQLIIIDMRPHED